MEPGGSATAVGTASAITSTAGGATAGPSQTASTPAPSITPESTVTPLPNMITVTNAVSVTQTATINTVGALGQIDQVTWSPDGGEIAAAGEGGVYLYNSETLSVEWAFNPGAWATGLDYSPDGKMLAVSSVNGTVQLWDLGLRELSLVLTGPGVRVEQAAFNPVGQGRTLASLGSDGRAHLWNAAEQRYVAGLGDGNGPGAGLDYSADGHWLAVAQGPDVRLWDAAAVLEGHQPSARALPRGSANGTRTTGVAFTPDGRWLAAGNAAGSIEVWQVSTGRLVLSLPRLTTPAGALAISPDGELLASAHHDMAIRLWDLRAGTFLATLAGHAELVTSLAFSPDGTVLASSGWDETVRLWGLGNSP